ncbi:MAG: DUF4830 domain-containing protein [Oscillospiraceae bacterium]|nr:DUF4830 domain-containing protein [Oscillospiraceae bacterium]
MFVCTVKASSIKFFAAILFSAAVLVGIVALLPVIDPSGEVAIAAVEYKGVDTVEEQLSFLRELGHEPDPNPVYAGEVVIPEVFDSVYETYNQLQKAQGLNLEKYKGKTVRRYTYALTPSGGETSDGNMGEVRYATLLIYKNRVIGGDITTTGPNGKVEGWA